MRKMIGGILSGNYAHTFNLLKLQAVFRRGSEDTIANG